ncbi:AAA family ATPase [Agarivorans sp. Alg241-V36]|uniref:AAA family ATPase n=1 Tax=Agarivorans sp. Alg241-V36 TaxID=2305992 RepID=UPI0013D16461|nr:SMC family ATPase [Agarivorans sp. Alg241-V36]
MRPITLSMSAFGPFAGTEEIDFRKLGRNPLFLLNGPTGAGKTTILDAICFALYGKSTGDEREAAQMRCDLADEALLTEVRFEFELGDKHYKIRRVPEQARLKKSGDGYTQQKPEAQLSLVNDDGSEELLVPAKVSEANSQIEMLTGLDADQFRQVMVLPQGKFRQLLMADSKEREKIFSQLFQTHIYRKIEDSLKTQAACIRTQALEQKNIREGILQSADLTEQSELSDELAQLSAQLEQALEQKQQTGAHYSSANKEYEAAKVLADDFNQQAALKTSLSALNKQKASISEKQTRLDQAKAAQAIEAFDTAKVQRFNEAKQASLAQSQGEAELSTAQQNLKKAQQQLEQMPEKEAQLAQAQEQLLSLQNFKPLIQELEKLKQQQTAAQIKLDSQAEQGKGLKQQLTELASSKVVLSEQLTSSRQLAETQADKQRLLGQAQQFLEQADALAKLNQQLNDNNAEVEQSADQGKQLKAHYQQAQQQANQVQLTWHQGQAAIMAQRLQTGDACPVCGSTAHPQLAVSQHALPSENDVEQARNNEQVARDKLEEARQHYKALKTKQSEWLSQQQNLSQLLGDKAAISVQQLRAELDAVQQALAAAQQAHSLTKQQQQQLEQTEQTELRLQAQVEQARELYQQTKSQLDVLQGQRESAEQNLPVKYQQPSILEDAINLQQQQVEQLKASIAAINQQHNTAREDLSAKQSAATAAKQVLQLAQQALSEAQAKFTEHLAKSSFANESAFNMALISDDEMAELAKELELYYSDLTKVSAQLEQLKAKLKGKKQQDLDGLAQALSKLLEQKDLADTEWNKFNNRQLSLLDIQNKLNQADKNAQSLAEQYQVVGTLADVANGQTGNKVSLQRFVLSVLLDDVLLQASQRLSIMSKGRYQLIRKEQRAKGNKASGLELEVEDSYTSKVRSVATLSGGESFMAALAMALGLSDVVQAYAGGIKLDTLFIDEGFGSLDQESLDLAIRTLVDLQSAGRMVGVISHVSEMKEQITSRIDVLKHSSGSTTHLHLP